MNDLSLPSEAAEESLLAAILYDPSVLADVSEIVAPASFSTRPHRLIFETMLACRARGAGADFANVNEALLAHGHDDLGLDLVHLLTADAIPAFTLDYARRVRHHATRRAVYQAATALAQRLHAEPEADPVEIANTVLAGVNELAVDENGPVFYADVIEAFQERLLDQRAGTWEPVVIPTGIRALDAKLGGGFRPADSVILAARPGMGKTALALQVMHNLARPPKPQPVLFFSAEMTRDSLVERGISEMSGVPLADVRQRAIDQRTYELLHRATEMMARLPLAIDDTSAITTRQMLTRAQRFQRQHGLGLVVFDYMELAGDDAGESEQLRVTRISHAMKHLAKSLRVPVVTLSQLSREVEKASPPVPRMAHIRMSGAIEADADIVLLLYRPDYYVDQGMVDYDATKEGITDIYIGKYRNGDAGVVSVRFDAPTMRFTDLDERIEPQRLMKVG